jgi:hypothetical protein
MMQKENMIRFLNGYTMSELRIELKRQNYIVITQNDFKKIINSLTPEFFSGLTEDGLNNGLKKIGIKNSDNLSKDQLISIILSDVSIEDALLSMINTESEETGIVEIISTFFITINITPPPEINQVIEAFYNSLNDEINGTLLIDNDKIIGIIIKDNVLTVNS